MGSSQYAADLEEVRSLAGAASTQRTAAQTEVARFYTEPPPPYWARNLRRFATASPHLADNARLMAMISVGVLVSGCVLYLVRHLVRRRWEYHSYPS